MLYSKNNFARVYLILITLLAVKTAAQNSPLVETFNYSKIANHPRLMLSKDDEVLLKNAIERTPEFIKIDAFIRESADKFILEEPLVFEKKGKIKKYKVNYILLYIFKSPPISLNISNAFSKSHIISSAIISGSGRFSASSRDLSLIQKII